MSLVSIGEFAQAQRHPLGGIRMVLVHNPANGERGPDRQFALAPR